MGRTYGQRKRFAITVGEVLGEGRQQRRVDVCAANRWLICDDNLVYVPHFAGRLQSAVGQLITEPTEVRCRPFPELSVEVVKLARNWVWGFGVMALAD